MHEEVWTIDFLTSLAIIGFEKGIRLGVDLFLVEEVETYEKDAIYGVKSWLENANLLVAHYNWQM